MNNIALLIDNCGMIIPMYIVYWTVKVLSVELYQLSKIRRTTFLTESHVEKHINIVSSAIVGIIIMVGFMIKISYGIFGDEWFKVFSSFDSIFMSFGLFMIIRPAVHHLREERDEDWESSTWGTKIGKNVWKMGRRSSDIIFRRGYPNVKQSN